MLLLSLVLNNYTNYVRSHSKLFTNCHVSWDTLYLIQKKLFHSFLGLTVRWKMTNCKSWFKSMRTFTLDPIFIQKKKYFCPLLLFLVGCVMNIKERYIRFLLYFEWILNKRFMTDFILVMNNYRVESLQMIITLIVQFNFKQIIQIQLSIIFRRIRI